MIEGEKKKKKIRLLLFLQKRHGEVATFPGNKDSVFPPGRFHTFSLCFPHGDPFYNLKHSQCRCDSMGVNGSVELSIGAYILQKILITESLKEEMSFLTGPLRRENTHIHECVLL